MTALNFFHAKPDPAYDAAGKALNQLFDAIGSENYYNFMRSKFPQGANYGHTWEEVTQIVARKLYTVTAEANQAECNCNGVEYCHHAVTDNDSIPF